MAKPWYQKLFSRSATPKAQAETAQPELHPGGSAAAQFALGLHCANAPRDRRNYEQAAEWYFKAASRNHALAQYNLGVMYGAGQGVPRDPAESESWFRKAALQGDAGAQYRMGWLCEHASFHGIGATESKIEAYKWYSLATAQAYADSNYARLKLTLRMAHEQVAEGGRRAASFMPANHSGREESPESRLHPLNHEAETGR
jgi:TPR repeat protein